MTRRLRAWRGAVEVEVEADNRLVTALAYPDLVGEPHPGDRVLLNTTALDLGLGTGSGDAFGCDLTEAYVRENAEYST